jgi:hypothetical protein
MLDIRTLQRALGGEISGNRLLCPGPGHRAADRSMSIKLDGEAPDGFLVHSFAGDDPIECKDYVRQKAGLEPFKPNGGSNQHSDNVTPITSARSNGRRCASDDAIERALMAAVASQSRNDDKPRGRIVATYNYTDADGALLYQVLRFDPKSFRQRRPATAAGFGSWVTRAAFRIAGPSCCNTPMARSSFVKERAKQTALAHLDFAPRQLRSARGPTI